MLHPKCCRDASSKELAMLNSFTYEDIEVVLHYDEHLMPVRKSDWSTFNFLFESTHESAMCTVWMNRFYPEWTIDKPIFQTITPFAEVATKKADLSSPVAAASGGSQVVAGTWNYWRNFISTTIGASGSAVPTPGQAFRCWRAVWLLRWRLRRRCRFRCQNRGRPRNRF